MIRTLKSLRRIQLVTTQRGNKKRACDVRRETGADVVINGTLFDYQKWMPVCVVKAGGKILSTSTDKYWGLAWMDDDKEFTPALSTELDKWDNFVSCVMMIRDGRKLDMWPSKDVARPAARTAIYHTSNGLTHIWCDENQNLTPEQLRDRLAVIGNVDWALMLDGGGSCQLSQDGDEYIYSARRVQNYLCFWEADAADQQPPLDFGSHYEPVVKAYFRSRDGLLKLSDHFAVWEFACNDGSDVVFVSPALVMVLEAVRMHFGCKVHITSGYRTPTYNRSKPVGGSPHSQHQLGLAADIQVGNVPPDTVAAYVRLIMPNHGGVGVYMEDGFTHVDVRAKRSDWRG